NAPSKTVFHPADSPRYGDEPFLIQQHLKQGKVFVGKDRVRSGQRVIADFHPDVLLLDDGFQHVRLHRDLNILLVEGEQGFGNGYLLPAGPLREPVTALYRADWIFFTKSDPTQFRNKAFVPSPSGRGQGEGKPAGTGVNWYDTISSLT